MALLLIFGGCAQSPVAESDSKRPPSDHWETSPSRKIATLSALDREAVMVADCEGGDFIALVVVPKKRPQLGKGRWPVSIILDGKMTIVQDWYVGAKGGYGTADTDPGFMTLMKALQEHREVEFVLKRKDAEIDGDRFTLNGARAAIDALLDACGKS